VALLILGFTVITLLLVVGGIDITAVQLARTRMMDAADGAALDAADSIDLASTYGAGLRGMVRLSDATVATVAAGYLARQPTPQGVSSWGLAPGTGSPDGHTAVVRVQGTARLPLAGPLLQAFGGSIGLDVESHARAVVQ